ncbi:MAG: aldolase/citrate lyase family protein [Brevundimonas sp.]
MAAMVAASSFAPEGTRGACPCVRAGNHFIRDWRGYVTRQRADVGVVALVETRRGLEAISDICAVEGVRALLIGPFDLSVSLGFAGDYRHRDVQAALDRMIAAAQAAGLPVIAPIFDPDIAEAKRQQASWLQRGAAHFVVGTDKILFSDAAIRYSTALATLG